MATGLCIYKHARRLYVCSEKMFVPLRVLLMEAASALRNVVRIGDARRFAWAITSRCVVLNVVTVQFSIDCSDRSG